MLVTMTHVSNWHLREKNYAKEEIAEMVWLFFEAALQAGTDDFRTLSAIYSQLGNAYFYLGDYVKAMQYHKHDLTLARTMGDRLGEAKASGNLGNTLKVMGKFE